MAQPPSTERPDTVIETDEEIRQALLAGPSTRQATVATEPARGAKPPAPEPRVASAFRPTCRPAMAFLTVFDDGKLDGEVIRIRDHRFVIGRTEGDLKIPIDGRVSSRHVEITHQAVGGLHRWVITDLQSTHGTFVRVSRAALADRAEFLVGNGRYRFDGVQADSAATAGYAADEQARGETQDWSDRPGAARPPALTEVLGREIGNRVVLVKPEYWIGSDPSCAIARPDDPFCEPRHVRVYRGPRGGWSAEHNKTQNGLWLRMTQVAVESAVQFQVGEQRFKLKVN